MSSILEGIKDELKELREEMLCDYDNSISYGIDLSSAVDGYIDRIEELLSQM